MDLFYQILFVLGDPEVRNWAHEIVDMAGAPDDEILVGDVHDAIDQPSRFIAEIESGDDSLRQTFMRYLRDIEHRGSEPNEHAYRRHLLRRQPFTRRLDIFSKHAVGALKMSLGGEARRFHVNSPSDEDLELYYITNIAKGTQLVRDNIDSLRDTALSPKLRQYLDALDEELNVFAGADASYDPVNARRRIWEVEWMVASAIALLHLPEQGFKRQGREIADALEASLKKVSTEDMQIASSHVKTIRACLDGDVVDGRVRDVVVEAHIYLSDFMFKDKHRRTGGKPVVLQPHFEDITSFAFALIELGELERALISVRKCTKDSAIAGAALLDATYRYRFRNDVSGFLKAVSPAIMRARTVAVNEDARDEVEGEQPAMKLNIRPAQSFAITGVLPGLIASRDPIHLEFGAGWALQGWELAESRDDIKVVSIDPDMQPAVQNYGYPKTKPANFIPLVGWAEDLAPFAARRPFAEHAIMIAPPRSALNSMILSALLAVKPGGSVVVYMDAFAKNDLNWLEEAGFEFFENFLRSDDPTLPLSKYLENYKGVRHVRINMHDIDNDGANTPGGRHYKLKGLHRVNPEQGTLHDLSSRSALKLAAEGSSAVASHTVDSTIAAAAGFGVTDMAPAAGAVAMMGMTLAV